MTFASPHAFWLLLLLPLLFGVKVFGDFRARRATAKMAAPRLLGALLARPGKKRAWVVLTLEAAAVACFITALARPQYGFLEEVSEGTGRSLIVAIDTSRSMLATDLQPDRLTRAKLAAIDLIKKLRGDRIGLMPFAGTAFIYAPITPDADALIESIDSLDHQIIPRGGSNLARAINLALETFDKGKISGQRVLILFSDGEELEGATLEAAKKAAEQRLTIICIGVGTQSGGVIPDADSPGGYYRDSAGKVVSTRLQRDVLVSIANTTGGLYLPIDGSGVNDSRIDLILQKLDRSAMKGKTIRKSLERYRWPLGAGMALLLGSFLAGVTRRHRVPAGGAPGVAPAATALLLTFLLLPAPIRAADAPAPTGNPWKYYEAGAWDAAVANFDRVLKVTEEKDAPAVQFAKGAAAYRKADFDSAISAFGAATLSQDWKQRASAHYNLGNAIYGKARDLAANAKPKQLMKLSFLDGLIRQLENSLENYQQAMLDPDNKDAKTNHDTTDKLIKKLREIRRQAAQAQGKGKGKKGQEGENEGEGDGEGDSPGKGKGKGKGRGKGGEQNGNRQGDDGEDGDEKGDGSGKEGETEKERAAREKSNQEREGKVGTDGEHGEGEKGKDGEGNKDGKGDKNGDGEPDDEGDPEAESSEDEIDPTTGFSRGEARRQMERLSDEDFSVRPQVEHAYEVSPAKDW